ncbi:MAG: hypothetical protein SH856_01700 [Flavobacteriales bacterium]|nr:hypothetical protein [Flavobacteriales bacterium]
MTTPCNQVGTFEPVISNLEIENGFIMSTGGRIGAQGPNNSPNHTGSSDGLYSGTDPDLVILVTNDSVQVMDVNGNVKMNERVMVK